MDLYDLYQSYRIEQVANVANDTASAERRSSERLEGVQLEFTQRINRMSLLNQAIAEMICDRMGITEKEILDKIYEVDMRDGLKDGMFNPPAKDCPQCGAKVCGKMGRCLFCGYIDTEPALNY